MLAEVKYTPGRIKAWEVRVKCDFGWKEIGSYLNEPSAVAAAIDYSLKPNLPYTLRFENGVRTNETSI